MSKLITAVFTSREAAEHAVDELVRNGFSRDDISLLMSDTTQGREFGIKQGTKAPEGAATGAAIGGTVGAIAAGLTAVASLTIPGAALVAAGPLVAALTGLGAGAAAGGLTGALVGMGIPENEATFFKNQIEKGRILVGVYTHGDRTDQAKHILDDSGAEKVRAA